MEDKEQSTLDNETCEAVLAKDIKQGFAEVACGAVVTREESHARRAEYDFENSRPNPYLKKLKKDNHSQ